jgi:HSP20 family protein
MGYIRFYNPYYAAFRDQNANSAYDRLVNRYSANACGCANVPATNITENDQEYQIKMALPGVSKENISINYDNGYLTVKVAGEEQNNGENYDHQEFNYKGTSRVFQTGQTINADQISAAYDNGILTIHLPKKEEYMKKPAQEITIM